MNLRGGRHVAGVLFAAILAGGGCAPGLARITEAHAVGTPGTSFASGLPTRSQDNLFYLSQNSVQLYNSPAGTSQADLVPSTSWLRDTTLVPLTTTAALHPTRSPIDLRLAPSIGAAVTATGVAGAVGGAETSSGAASVSGLAAIASEDQVPLGLSVSTIAGQAPLSAAGQVSGETLTYPAVAGSTDVALRATAEGLDTRVVLRGRIQSASIVFTLTLPPNFHLAQEKNGSISVNETLTVYSDHGTPAFTEESHEYYIESPVVRDGSGDSAAPITYGTATMALGAQAGNTQQITVAIDPTWLQDARRALPIQLDLPIVTGPAANETGLFGTLSSCQTDLPAPAARMIVGVQGGCIYHGLAYFDLGPIGITRRVQTIQAATLSLYTPGQAGPTGVQVYANTPPTRLPRYAPLSWEPPTWNTAPAAITGTTGLVQSSSDGHWQRWDVTSLVQQWQNDPYSNGGITLVGSGAPVAFASAAGAGDDAPAYAPHLDVTFAPVAAPASSPAAVSPNFNLGDPVNNIYGLSQGITTDGTCGGAPQCAFPNGVETGTVHFWRASYVRIPAPLACGNNSPGVGYWNNTYKLLNSVYGDGSNLIPIVVFNYPGGSCQVGSFSWAAELQDFANNMKNPGSALYYRSQPWNNTYFEIENEPSNQPDWNGCYNGTCGLGYGYVSTFATAAPALNTALNNNGLPNGRILTGGVIAPVSGYCGGTNDQIMQQAISAAETNGVAQGRLGVAVHPYGYTTRDNGQWQNYKGQLGRTTTTCTDLGFTINRWAYNDFPNLPVFFTEINFSSSPTDWNNYSNNRSGEAQNGADAYAADLVTYLDDFGDANVSTSQIRSLWFTGVEFPNNPDNKNGLYTQSASEKFPSTVSTNTQGQTFPGLASGLICPNRGGLNGQLNNLSYTYVTLIQQGPCY